MTITEHGYVIQWRDGTIYPSTFAASRHACWMSFCAGKDLVGYQVDFPRARAAWKRNGTRCVPATRTIETEE